MSGNLSYMNDSGYILEENSTVICVDNNYERNYLTIGKSYIVQDTYHNVGIYVVDDQGDYEMYDYANFLPIDIYRSNIIDNILE